MGGKKKFIDKKKAVTYHLNYRSNGLEDEEEGSEAGADAPPQGVPIDAYAAGIDPDLVEYFGLASIYDDGGYEREMTEERRKEIVELGLPDDGYDYLRHLRATGPPRSRGLEAGKAPAGASAPAAAAAAAAQAGAGAGPSTSAPAPAGAGAAGAAGEVEAKPVGPSVFIPAPVWVPPEVDVKLVDARQLTVDHTVEEDEEADAALAEVSAFARPAHKAPAKGRLATELQELEQSMLELEKDAEEVMQGGEGGDDWGDWLDEFVVTAAHGEEGGPTAAGGTAAQGQGSKQQQEGKHGDDDEGEEEFGSEGSFDEEEEEDEEGPEAWAARRAAAGAAGAAGPGAGRRPKAEGSIASSYWRPERDDRKQGFEVLDARFDKLATQYEDHELGEMEEDDGVGGCGAAEARGNADISAFAHILDDFLAEQKAVQAAVGAPGAAKAPGAAAAAGEEEDEEDEEEEVEFREDMSEAEYEEAMRRAEARRGAQGNIAGTSGSKKVESLEQRDEEAIAATRARLEAAATAAAANGVTADDGGDDGPAAAGARAASQGLSKSGIPLGLLPDQMTTVVLDRGEKWDCESVLSLRSNLSNHPGRIVEPQKRSGTRGGGTIVLSSKTGAPILQPTGVVPLSGRALAAAAKEAAKADAIAEEDGEGQDEDEDEKSEGAGEGSGSGSEEGGVLLLERRKGETAEEKKARKAAVKEARRQARTTKKELKTMFKTEASKQKKQAAGRAATGGQGGTTFVLP